MMSLSPRRLPGILAAAGFLLSLPVGRLDGQVSFRGGASRAAVGGAAPGLGSLAGGVGGVGFALGGARFAVRPELLYLRKAGTRLANPGVLVGLDYLEVPVLTEWRLRSGNVVISGLAGGYGAARTTCLADQCTDGMRGWDYGVALGVGLRSAGRPSLGIELRFDQGLAPLDAAAGARRHTRALLLLGSVTL